MVIHLSPALEERVVRAAQAKGIPPERWVEEALTQYLNGGSESGEPVSEARQRLRELSKYKKRVADFDAALHEARRYARQLEEDNAEFIESAARRFAPPESHESQ